MKKIISRVLFSLFFCLGLLICFMLNPSLIYGNATQYKNMVIHHNGDLNPKLKQIIDISYENIKNAKIYSPTLQTELCLNEGIYPSIIQFILGDDVFTAFSNKVIVLGKESSTFNQFGKWGKELKYSQFLSHALIHNMQFDYHGLWDANPLGGHPQWKWEGYVEYEVLGHLASLEQLVALIQQEQTNDFDWVRLSPTEGTIKRHIKYLAMVKYCLEDLRWDYDELMESQKTEEAIMKELIAHSKQTNE